jgi:uncharacterized protein (UPF0333 family)
LLRKVLIEGEEKIILLQMLRNFIDEEEGQSGLEYILLIGGMVMAAMILFVIYKSMTESAGGKMNETSDPATVFASSKVNAALADL